jgi:hypothetical protein
VKPTHLLQVVWPQVLALPQHQASDVGHAGTRQLQVTGGEETASVVGPCDRQLPHLQPKDEESRSRGEGKAMQGSECEHTRGAGSNE